MSDKIQDIIDYIDRKYPNNESTTNKIKDLDIIYKEAFNQIKKFTDEYSIFETYTIANRFTYSLPTRCKIYMIKSLLVSADTRTNITVNTKWQEYKYGSLNTIKDNDYYYTRVSDSVFGLSNYGLPISTSDLIIKIFYYKIPNDLTLVGDTIELDKIYTSILRYGLINSIASQGNNPDTKIADYYQRKYDEQIDIIKDSFSDNTNVSPIKYNEVQERW